MIEDRKGYCRGCGIKSRRVQCDKCKYNADHAMRIIAGAIRRTGEHRRAKVRLYNSKYKNAAGNP